MDAKKENEFSIGSSAFWVLISLICISGMTYLAVESYNNNSIQGGLLAFLFFSMVVSAILFSRFKIFDMGTWGQNTFSFTLGFLLWTINGAIFGTQSIISVSENQLFSSLTFSSAGATSQIPELLNFIMTVFVIPISEEMFWMIAIPFGIITVMSAFGNKYEIFNNKILQIFAMIVIGGFTFVVFHTQNIFWSFIIASFVFRSVMIVFVWGDQLTNWITPIDLLVPFAVGGHIANNMFAYGLEQSWLMITSNFQIGIFIILLMLLLFLSGINYMITDLILNNNKNKSKS